MNSLPGNDHAAVSKFRTEGVHEWQAEEGQTMSNIKPGDKARIKKTGEVFTVDDVNPDWFAGPECDECYAEGLRAHGSVTIDHPDEIEKVDWTEPTPEVLAKALSAELHKWGDGIEIHETDPQGDGLVAVLGRWNGVEGGFYVRFGSWQEDML